VNGEYLEAFRTKSYVEICNIAHRELGNASTNTNSFKMHLTEYLLEPPQQEIVANMKVHRLLVDYFEASLEACRCCETIVQAIHQTRLAYARVTNVVVKLSQTAPYYDQSQNPIHTQLSSFVLLQNNPLSIVQFHDIHDRYMTLLSRLLSKKRKIQRILTIKSVCKKVGGIGLIVSQGVLMVALLVFAFHSVIGFVAAAPCIVGLVMKKRFKRSCERFNTRNSCMKLCEQLDVAAKGVYVVINELDTMSRMVKRLDDEVEHWRQVADICVKNYCKCEILKRVVKEFQDNESNFLDMLEELEEHIYLCFLTVNRFRRLVMEEIMGKQR